MSDRLLSQFIEVLVVRNFQLLVRRFLLPEIKFSIRSEEMRARQVAIRDQMLTHGCHT